MVFVLSFAGKLHDPLFDLSENSTLIFVLNSSRSGRDLSSIPAVVGGKPEW